MKKTSVWKSLLRRLFSGKKNESAFPVGNAEKNIDQQYRIPTVRFDKALVTPSVKANVKESILKIPDINPQDAAQAYNASIESVQRGGDLFILSKYLREDCGIPTRRSGDIARFINNRATSMANKERQQTLGIARAEWEYSNSPCEPVLRLENVDGPKMDKAHKAANGKQYDVEKGLCVDDKWTWPGYEDGCKCFSKSVIPGL